MTIKTYSSAAFFKKVGQPTFGEILRGFRLSDEMNQTEFAKRLGISAANLCDLEKGRKIPSPSRAVHIAKRLGLPEPLLIQIALQDALRRDRLHYKVSIAA